MTLTATAPDAPAPQPGCPYAWYRAMRAAAPVVKLQPGLYAVTGYDDIKAVLMDPATYPARLGDNNAFAMFGPSPVQAQIDEIMRAYPEEPVLMRTDPPLHTRVRNLVNRALTPAVVQRLEPTIQAIVDELMAPWIGSGEVEFVEAFAARLPNAVTTGFLGAPPAMREQLRFWAGEVMSRFEGPQPAERQLAVARHIAEMARYFFDQIAARRQAPGDDIVSLLAQAEIDGDRLEDTAIINVIETFLIGGHETTTFTLSQCLLYLAQQPALADHLRTHPEALPEFIEEILRLEAPAQSVQRATARDVTLGGVQVPAGSVLFLFLAAANRDERQFADPDALQPARQGKTPGRHVAFGYGAHTCLGMHLARAELRIALRTLLPRMQALRLPPDPVTYLENWALRGPVRLALHFTPA